MLHTSFGNGIGNVRVEGRELVLGEFMLGQVQLILCMFNPGFEFGTRKDWRIERVQDITPIGTHTD